MSYRKKHIKNKIHKIKPKKSILKRRWFWFSLLSLIIIFSVLYFVLFYPGIQIKNILISGNQEVAGEDIKNLISGHINNKILSIGNWIVDSKSIFLINADKIKKDILDKFLKIEGVKINKKFPQTLVLDVAERKPFGVFCAEDNGCFLIDGNGIIFESLQAIPQNMIIVRQATDSSQILIGEKIVQQNVMDLLLKIGKNLKDNFQISLKDALIASSLRLNVSTNEDWKIYFDLGSDSDIDMQLTKLDLLLSGEISAGVEDYPRKNLRYIDLRPKDKAIICDNKICGD